MMRLTNISTLVHYDRVEKEEDYLIIAEFPQIDYALIYRGGCFEPWVAAWGLNKEENYWSQGHYFKTINGAMRWIQSKLDIIPYDRMNEIASKAVDILSENDLLEDLNYEVDLEDKEYEWFGLSDEEMEDAI